MNNEDALLQYGITKTVYSIVYPETSAILDRLWKESPHTLYERAYEDTQDLYHLNFASAWLNWARPVLNCPVELSKHFYPTAGSSEAIRDSIAVFSSRQRAKNVEPVIHIFEGEYEGYEAVAQSFQVKVIKHDRSNYKEIFGTDQGEGLFYLSQPSAINGNVWMEFQDFVKVIEKNQPNLKIMVDLCYVGTVPKNYYIDLRSPKIESIFFSLSKVYGVYYHRIGGVFSRNEIPSLYGNRWFKNLFSLKFGQELLKSYGVFDLAKKYQKIQIESLNDLNFKNIYPSDVILLAHKEQADTKEEKILKRTKECYRFCLTAAMSRKLGL